MDDIDSGTSNTDSNTSGGGTQSSSYGSSLSAAGVTSGGSSDLLSGGATEITSAGDPLSSGTGSSGMSGADSVTGGGSAFNASGIGSDADLAVSQYGSGQAPFDGGGAARETESRGPQSWPEFKGWVRRELELFAQGHNPAVRDTLNP